MRFAFLACVLGLLITAPALADDENALRLPPAGHVILNLSATETERLPQDLLVASLRIELEDDKPSSLQTRINDAMKKALELAKAKENVKAETGAYSVYQVTWPEQPVPKDRGMVTQAVKWRGSQTITFKSSKDAEAVLDLTGKIQELGFAMNSMEYTLSPEKHEGAQDALLEKALKKLNAKAALVAKSLGKSGYELVDVNVNDGGVMPYYGNAVMMRSDMAMEAKAAPPVAQAGESDVSLSVSARALLKP